MEKVPKTPQKAHFPLGSFLSTFSNRFSLDNSQKLENLRQLVLAKNIEVGAQWTEMNGSEATWTQVNEMRKFVISQTLYIAPNDPTRACSQDILYFRL